MIRKVIGYKCSCDANECRWVNDHPWQTRENAEFFCGKSEIREVECWTYDGALGIYWTEAEAECSMIEDGLLAQIDTLKQRIRALEVILKRNGIDPS
jgi:hypothetical protein